MTVFDELSKQKEKINLDILLLKGWTKHWPAPLIAVQVKW